MTRHPDFDTIARAIRFLEETHAQQRSLDQIASHLGISKFHLQRLFTRWAGVSPKRFLRFLTVENAKSRLRQADSVLQTSLEVGLSGPSRLHDLFVKGTNFQVKVWQALLSVLTGALTTYGRLARVIGQPRGARAVGSAVARNPPAYVIPCQRVIRESGHFGEYRWGADRKKAILGWEASRGAA